MKKYDRSVEYALNILTENFKEFIDLIWLHNDEQNIELYEREDNEKEVIMAVKINSLYIETNKINDVYRKVRKMSSSVVHDDIDVPIVTLIFVNKELNMNYDKIIKDLRKEFKLIWKKNKAMEQIIQIEKYQVDQVGLPQRKKMITTHTRKMTMSLS